MHLHRILLFFPLILLISGCVTLKPPEITKNEGIENYRFVVIPNTASIGSGAGAVYGNQYGVYGGTTTKVVDPGAIIEGILLKQGLIGANEVDPEDESRTLLLRYGQSGKRTVAGGLGYTLEVTIVMLSAQTKEIVYSCVAEGIGDTEADDIREAIHRCLSGL